MTEEIEEKSLRDTITEAVAEVSEKQEDAAPEKDRDESGKFKAKEEVAPDNEPVLEKEPVEAAPTSLSGAIKAKWGELPEDVRQEWAKREKDVHQMMTRHDGDLNLGREMKDVVMPYMATIQAEGGTPATAVKDLLNTAYQLRTGSPQQKAQMVQNIIKAYNVDMGQSQVQENVDPTISALYQEINDLKQRSNPEVIKKQLQDEYENDTINQEVNAFASDPANIHYEKVKGVMASLLVNGQAKDLKEAYESAIWSDPSVRSTLMQAKPVDVQAKKAAASSITGSPGTNVPNSGAPDRSLRDEIAANVRAAMSS